MKFPSIKTNKFKEFVSSSGCYLNHKKLNLGNGRKKLDGLQTSSAELYGNLSHLKTTIASFYAHLKDKDTAVMTLATPTRKLWFKSQELICIRHSTDA
ncbi:CLUMA_CG009725, isoform A [Clunio marinus]|uniref:CLUMA_CG009725, isoform A n=1 Tax=Clunio marinus TaxID=568069 RepID=A0A1J1I995_9DIPT|nr:CLUMA_CG009725, isoform A [Clunio marinus]